MAPNWCGRVVVLKDDQVFRGGCLSATQIWGNGVFGPDGDGLEVPITRCAAGHATV